MCACVWACVWVCLMESALIMSTPGDRLEIFFIHILEYIKIWSWLHKPSVQQSKGQLQ